MKRFEKWSLWITSSLTVATGAGYFVTKYLFTSPDPYSVVGHPWQPYFLKAHILVSPLLLFALGLVAVDHVWTHWVEGVQVSRRTAIATALSIVPMVVTGYLIQVLTVEGWVRAMAMGHIAFGTLYAVGFVAHTWIVRRSGRVGGPGGRGGSVRAPAVAVASALLLQGGPAARPSPAQVTPAPEPPRERAERAGTASSADRSPERPVRTERTWPAMGTLLHASARAPEDAAAEGAVRAARTRVLAVDSLMSTYRPDSDLSRVNRAAGREGPVSVSAETARVLEEALRWARLTGGAFDPTAGPLGRAWGFHEGEPRVPPPAARDSAARLVGWERVEQRETEPAVRLPEEGMRLDLGAVAKGHALDAAVGAMRARGAEAGMVDLGGNLRVFGPPPGDAAGSRDPEVPDREAGSDRDAGTDRSTGGWRLGIRHPRGGGTLLGTLSLDSGAVATSGDAEQFFERGGVRYSHIMDPRSGRPARGVAQVTVVAREASTADALATALFVLGPDRGLEWLRRNDRIGPGRDQLSLALWVRDPEGGPVCPRHLVRAGPGADRVDLRLGEECPGRPGRRFGGAGRGTSVRAAPLLPLFRYGTRSSDSGRGNAPVVQ